MAKGWRKHDYDVAAFGERLTKCRAALGWSLRRLAREAGLNPGSLSAAERGRRSLPEDNRKNLVDALMAGVMAADQAVQLPFGRRAFVRSAGLDFEEDAEIAFVQAFGPDLEAAIGPPLPRHPEPDDDLLPDAAIGDHGPLAGWQYLWDRAEELKREQAWGAALARARVAQLAARDGVERSLALVTESEAWWHLGRHKPALWATLEAIDALGLGGAPLESGSVPPQVLAASERALFAYFNATHCLGLIYFRLGHLAVAARCFDVVVRIGELIGDRRVWTEALHMQMRCLVDQGSRPATDGSWREVSDRGSIERAFADLADMEAPRLVAPDEVFAGHHFRWKDRVLRLLGQPDEAEAAREQAASRFADHPAIYHVRLDQGRLAIDDDEPLRAEAHLSTSLELARAVRHTKTVSDALGGLAYLACVSSMDYRRALDLGVCALLAYPYALGDIDGARTLALCEDLIDYLAADAGQTWAEFWRRYRDTFEDGVAAARPPFDSVADLVAGELDMEHRGLDAIAHRLHLSLLS